MMKKVLIAPSLMAADMLHLKDEAQAVEAAKADWLHLDIMDGNFVPNLTFGPDIVSQLRTVCALPFDVHLMVTSVELCIDLYHKAGADHITIHTEATTNLYQHLSTIKARNCKAGVSLNPGTSIDTILSVLDRVDQVLVMSVNPGFYGQAFIPTSQDKIAALARIRKEKNLNFRIVVDGGINPQNAPSVIASGADVLVAGNSVFKQPNYLKAIGALRGWSKTDPSLPGKGRGDYIGCYIELRLY